MKNSRRVIAPSSPFSFLSIKSARMLALVFAGVISILAGHVQAQSFPSGPADDPTQSLGGFKILVATQFRPLMVGYLGYDGVSRLKSPTMYDQNTIIGRSDVHLDGSAADISGTPVGTAGTIISDGSFSVVPPGFQGPANTREVHTEVRSLHLSAFGDLVWVKAGVLAPGRPISPGEVESNNTGGIGLQPDFPAQSFFDVFVRVQLPAMAAFPPPGGTLVNTAPLMVANDSLLAFPPTVVYIHENSEAVPIFFETANPGFWQAGDVFGYMVLAGHGTFDSLKQQEIEDKFNSIMDTLSEMPTPTCVAKPGDANASGAYTLGDVISIVNYIFNKPGCTPQPLCWLTNLLCRGDWGGNGLVSLTDVIRAVNYIFNKPGGPWNAQPSGVCCTGAI